MAHGEDGHGNLIPPVVLILFWIKRKELLALPNRAWWPGLVMLVGALVLHIDAYMIQQPKISIVALFAGIYAMMGMAWGPWLVAAKAFSIFPVCFLHPDASFDGRADHGAVAIGRE